MQLFLLAQGGTLRFDSVQEGTCSPARAVHRYRPVLRQDPSGRRRPRRPPPHRGRAQDVRTEGCRSTLGPRRDRSASGHRGRRAGSRPARRHRERPSIVALGYAVHLAGQAMADGETERLTVLREHLHRFLEGLLPGRVHLNGHPTRRLPNALHVSIEGTRALDGLSDSTDLPPPLAPPAMPGRTRRPPSWSPWAQVAGQAEPFGSPSAADRQRGHRDRGARDGGCSQLPLTLEKPDAGGSRRQTSGGRPRVMRPD